ncbi:MAG: hypothetical protein QOE77_1184 [Blastocatellia bacterium]|jgi:recombinational DNA repair ATPase RecF|nr:hypothetical protein [Blastocatellia bacterium]
MFREKLEHLRLGPLRGLKRCDLLNLGRINVLSGKNNTGKSTLLEAASRTQDGQKISPRSSGAKRSRFPWTIAGNIALRWSACVVELIALSINISLRWSESCGTAKLNLRGAAFVAEVEDPIQRLLASPTTWAVIEEPQIRRCLLTRFLYSIYYRWEQDQNRVSIYAVMHFSRRPGYWRQRLK